MIDVLVAGAGPVGLAFAIDAAQKGLEVQVLDPRATPVDKACGEGLMPSAVARLAEMGVDPPGLEFTGIRYISPGHSALAHFSAGPGRGVRRTILQTLMQGRARDLGVQFAEDRITEVVQESDSIRAGRWTARYLVGADGLHSQVRSALKIPAVTGNWHRFGIRQHFEVAPWTKVVEVYWLPHAELYVTPIDEATVGVAVLGSAPLDLDFTISQVPSLAWRLKNAPRTSSARGAGPMNVRVGQRRAGRAILIGDAAGYVDALTGEGLRIGFEQAHAAVSRVLAHDLGQYERDWQRITRSYRVMTSSLLFAAKRNSLRSAIVPTAQTVPRAFTHMVNLL